MRFSPEKLDDRIPNSRSVSKETSEFIDGTTRFMCLMQAMRGKNHETNSKANRAHGDDLFLIKRAYFEKHTYSITAGKG